MSTTQKQGWLDRQRQACRGGWRVRVLRRWDGPRELEVEGRGDQMRLAAILDIGVVLFAATAGALMFIAVTGGSGWLFVLGASAAVVAAVLVIALCVVDEWGWIPVPVDEGFPSVSAEEVAAAVEGVEPVRMGDRMWRRVPAERVPALDAAAERARRAHLEQIEAERAEATLRADEEVAAAARADDQFLERLQGRGRNGGEAQQRLEEA